MAATTSDSGSLSPAPTARTSSLNRVRNGSTNQSELQIVSKPTDVVVGLDVTSSKRIGGTTENVMPSVGMARV